MASSTKIIQTGGGSSGSGIGLFSGIFGGDGSAGNITIASNTNFSTIDSPQYWLQANNLTVDVGQTLTIDEGFAYIGVRGDCTIHGTINADGKGCLGVGNTNGEGATYVRAQAAISIQSMATLDALLFSRPFHYSIFYSNYTPLHEATWNYDDAYHGCGGAGAGGYAQNGGGAGGPGGGAWIGGGVPSPVAAAPTPAAIITYMDNMIVAQDSPGIYTAMFYGRGGAGGSDGVSSTPGSGGGVIYIEVAGTLVFDGALTSNGTAGLSNGFGWAGSGGGGTIVIRANTITTNSGTVTVLKGTNAASYNGADGYSKITTGG